MVGLQVVITVKGWIRLSPLFKAEIQVMDQGIHSR